MVTRDLFYRKCQEETSSDGKTQPNSAAREERFTIQNGRYVKNFVLFQIIYTEMGISRKEIGSIFTFNLNSNINKDWL